MSRATKVTLLLILALAGALRFTGLGFGLPLLHVRPDEYMYVMVSENMARTGSPNPHMFMYPGLAFYLFFAVDWLVFLVARIATPATTAASLADFIAAAPDTFIWIHRLVSAGLGTVTVLVAFHLGRTLSTDRAGLGAALLTAVAFLHVRDSHFGVVDVPLTLTVCLTLLAALRHVRTGTVMSLLTAAALTGLATAQKYNAGVLCVPLVIAHLAAARAGERAARAPHLVAAGIVTAGVFLAAAPYTVLDFAAFRSHFGQQWDLFQGAGPTTGVTVTTWKSHLLLALRLGLGEPWLAAALVALAALFMRPDRRRWIPASFVLVYFAAMCVGEKAFFRYMVPLVPLLAVLAADGVARIAGRFSRAATATTAVVLALAVVPFTRSLAFDRCIHRADTRLEARNWIEKNVAPDDVVMAGDWAGHDFRVTLPKNTIVRHHPGRLLREAVKYLVFAGDHPLYRGGFPGLDALLGRGLRTRLVFERRGMAKGTKADAVFDPQDAFLTPFSGFAGCLQPGPTVRIWRIDGRRDPAASPPAAPRGFAAAGDGKSLRLSWQSPATEDVVCTLVYITGVSRVQPGFYPTPAFILPPDRTTVDVPGLAADHYMTLVSFVSAAGESQPSKLIEIDMP